MKTKEKEEAIEAFEHYMRHRFDFYIKYLPHVVIGSVAVVSLCVYLVLTYLT